ncbi:unnamed protein product [Blepharisma stoltei]|uniref:PDEase domain-containing protein n=1 Tax=Blepharisma stoltei TaxID=1481888 RepID=A0AAU9K5R7_9CILI|nr:unnamed protein product [Blepharisma stoltei]
MNRSKMLEMVSDTAFFKFAKSSLYSIADNESLESKRIPINPNLLTFNDKFLEKRFHQQHTCQKGVNKGPSSEFKNNMLIFFIFLFSYIAITISTAILLYSSSNQSQNHLIIRVIFLTMILTVSFCIIYVIFKSSYFLNRNKQLFILLGSIFMTYLIICDERVLCGITSTDYEKNSQNHMLVIACFIVFYKLVIFDHFVYVALLSLLTLIFLLIFMLAFSPLSYLATLSDYLVLLVFLILQVIDSWQIDYRAKQLFWRREQEEEALDPLANEENGDVFAQQMWTEIELLLHMCDKIKANIKQSSAVIMFKDIKNKLKSAQSDIEKVKRGIAHGLIMAEIKVNSDGMDEQDRVFLSEYCMDHSLATKFKSLSRRPSTMDLKERDLSFPFSSYGVAELESVLSSIGKNWNFDIWFVYNATGHSIFIVAKFLFEKWNLSTTFSINEETIDRFFKTLERNYHQNPYHNSCHAADVLHTMLYFLTTSEIVKHLNPIEIISLMVACLGHDVGHPALTSRFLINNRDEIAMIYNDSSVLENMHISKIYGIMGNKGCNIFENIDSDDWVKARKLIIEMILETDMSRHFEILGRFRARAKNLADLALDVHDDKILILSMALKCADIGHSAKISELHEKWTALVCEEFFRQGDLEKQRNQQVSMYCDRDTTEIPKSQAGFIKNICLPLFDVWCEYLNNDAINKYVLEQLKKNLNYWEEKTRVRRASMQIIDTTARREAEKKFLGLSPKAKPDRST